MIGYLHLALRVEDNECVGREDRAMLRSNPSARADARAWAAILVSLLIPSLPCPGRQCDKPTRTGARKLTNHGKPGCHMSLSPGCGQGLLGTSFPVVARNLRRDELSPRFPALPPAVLLATLRVGIPRGLSRQRDSHLMGEVH
jgi:hypothetical protein